MISFYILLTVCGKIIYLLVYILQIKEAKYRTKCKHVQGNDVIKLKWYFVYIFALKNDLS